LNMCKVVRLGRALICTGAPVIQRGSEPKVTLVLYQNQEHKSSRLSVLRVGPGISDPEDEVHWCGRAAEGAQASRALGAMAVTVESNLSHCLCDRDCGAGERARLDLSVKLGRSGAGEPIKFELFGLAELVGEAGVRFWDPLLLLVNKGLAKGEEEPVAVGDEDVVEKLAE
jgi:hypothetical protein